MQKPINEMTPNEREQACWQAVVELAGSQFGCSIGTFIQSRKFNREENGTMVTGVENVSMIIVQSLPDWQPTPVSVANWPQVHGGE